MANLKKCIHICFLYCCCLTMFLCPLSMLRIIHGGASVWKPTCWYECVWSCGSTTEASFSSNICFWVFFFFGWKYSQLMCAISLGYLYLIQFVLKSTFNKMRHCCHQVVWKNTVHVSGLVDKDSGGGDEAGCQLEYLYLWNFTFLRSE